MSIGLLKTFYGSHRWTKCRNAYFVAVYGLCEKCGAPGEIVHHKEPICLNDLKHNIDKVFGWDNLELVCRQCHELAHSKRIDGLTFDDNGDIVFVETAAQMDMKRDDE